MDLDRFAPLIIFLIVFISVIRKHLARKKKAADTTDAPAPKHAQGQWLGKLVDALNQVKTEIEAAKQKTAREKEDPWEQIRPPKPAQPGLVWDKNVLKEDAPAPLIEELEPPPEPVHVKAEEIIVPETIRSRSKKRSLKRIPLRQAVVWSEILGPPVSLRDDI